MVLPAHPDLIADSPEPSDIATNQIAETVSYHMKEIDRLIQQMPESTDASTLLTELQFLSAKLTKSESAARKFSEFAYSDDRHSH